MHFSVFVTGRRIPAKWTPLAEDTLPPAAASTMAEEEEGALQEGNVRIPNRLSSQRHGYSVFKNDMRAK